MDAHSATELLRALLTPQLLALLAAGQLIQIASLYVASKLVAGPTATSWNALRCYGYQLALSLVGVLVLGIAGFVAAKLGGGFVVLVLIAGAAVALWAVVRVPMFVYEIGAWSAIGLLILAAMATSLLNVGLRQILPVQVDPAAMQRLVALATSRPEGLPALPASALSTSAPTESAAPSRVVAAAKRKLEPNRPVPAEVTVSEAVRVPIKLDGRTAGDVELSPGTKLKVVADDGDYVKVLNLDTVVRIPKSKLSY